MDMHSKFELKLPKLLEDEYTKLPAHIRKRIPLKQFQLLGKAQLPELKANLQELVGMALPITQRVISQGFEKMIGILCLTESPANLLMWAHYADAHQGSVIEFDSDVPFFDQRKSSEDDLRHLRKVIYSDQRSSFILDEMKDLSPFLTKSLDWSYEAEWRMMLPLSSAPVVIGEGPTAIHLFEYPRSAIRSVIFGCRMSESKEEEIRRILDAVDDFKNIQCLKAQIDDKKCQLRLTDSKS